MKVYVCVVSVCGVRVRMCVCVWCECVGEGVRHGEWCEGVWVRVWCEGVEASVLCGCV